MRLFLMESTYVWAYNKNTWKCLLRKIRRMNVVLALLCHKHWCWLLVVFSILVQKIAIELVVGDVPRLRCESFMTGSKCIPLHTVSNIECFKLGLEDYILKHGNSRENICHSCFSSGWVLRMQIPASCRII